MWQEEQFLFKVVPEYSHYLTFLFLGLFAFYLMRRSAETLRSVEAMSLTVILYICRPWEVLPPDETWLSVPRWCIWIWAFLWLNDVEKKRLSLTNCLKFSAGIKLSLIMGGWCLFTTLFSGDPEFSRQYFIDTLFRGLVLAILMHLSVQAVASTQRLEWAFVVGVTALIFHSLWHYHGLDMPDALSLISERSALAERRLTAVGSLGNSNDIAAVALIPMGFAVPLLFSRRSHLLVRVSAGVVFLYLIQAVLAAQSRGALMAVSAQMILYFISQSKRSLKWSFLPALGIALAAIMASSLMGRKADDLDASTESRMNYYVTGLRMALYSPIWGQGFGRYPYEFEKYTTVILHEWGLRTAHSSWILVLSETGLVGLLLFASIHVRIWKICWSLRRDRPSLLLSFVGYSLATLFLSHAWLMFPWVLFAIIDLNGKCSIDASLPPREVNNDSGREDTSLDCPQSPVAGALRCELRQHSTDGSLERCGLEN
ncbi:MAG: hypothetical protein RIR26_1816 [Pseudomonadota bacterium]